MIRNRRRGAVSAGLAILIVFIVLVLGAGGCVASRYNSMVSSQESVDQKFSQIDNQYKRRFELIPQLVKTVSGAADFEKGLLTEVTEARASVGRMKVPSTGSGNPAELEQYLKAQENLGGALGRLMVTVEAYPQLKATEGFRDLQVQIEGTENRIAVARSDYIAAIKKYNTTIRTFPSNLFASSFGFERLPQMELGGATERAVPDIDFGDK